jgi:hypothetical protein
MNDEIFLFSYCLFLIYMVFKFLLNFKIFYNRNNILNFFNWVLKVKMYKINVFIIC